MTKLKTLKTLDPDSNSHPLHGKCITYFESMIDEWIEPREKAFKECLEIFNHDIVVCGCKKLKIEIGVLRALKGEKP